MAYTSNQLITGAYYAAGVVSREFETLNGPQATDGLQWFNDIISEKRVDEAMIPYETTFSFNAKIGVEKYFIPNLIQIDTLTFFLDSVRYPMVFTKRNLYFGRGRVQDISTLPFEGYFERQVGGGNLYLYFKPDKNYIFEIHGLFNLDNVSLNQDLLSNVTTVDLGIPTFYGLGSINPSQFVVNNFDLMGNYPNIGSLVNYINSGIIPGVMATIVVNDLVLSSLEKPPVPIYINTNGYAPNGTRTVGSATTLSFSNLSAFYSNGAQGVGATLTALSPGILSISGYAVQLNERVLINGQTDSSQNGIYTLSTLGTATVQYILTRASGYNKTINIGNGDIITITNGLFNGENYIQTSEVLTIGLSQIHFIPFNALTFSNFSTIGLANYEVFNSVGFDQFYITYLRYALAYRICAEYNYSVPPLVREMKIYYEALISKKSRVLDLQMKKVSTLQAQQYVNYGFVNLGKGWTPT